jgi:hypothetical protein
VSFLPFSFSIVGVQKAGTSTLQWMLNQHPEVARPPRKEMGWFDVDDATWRTVDHAAYGIKHAQPIHRALGDATPRYLLMPGALERMHADRPDLSLIAIFRDPIDRLVSQWVMVRDRQPDRAPDWPEMIQWRPDDFPTEMPAQFEGPGGRARFMRASGVIRGYYGGQVRHGLSLFPRDQWLFLDFAELLSEPAKTLDTVTRHIDVGRFKPYPPLKKLMAGSPQITGTAPTGEDLMVLAKALEPELAEFVALTGRSVDHWTTERLLNGELDPDEQARVYARKAGLTSGWEDTP